MRRLLLVLAIGAAAATAAGCGGSKPPLDQSLGYLPKDTPFVVAINTDTGGGQYKNLGRLVRRFPFGPAVADSLKRELARRVGVDFDRDVKPLLGNDFVVGATDARSFTGGSAGGHFVGAIKAKDEGKLDDLVKRAGSTKEGEKQGASIYRDTQGNDFAVKGSTLVVAGSRSQLEDALTRSSDGKGLSRKSFDDGLQDLPSTALVRGYFDVGRLLRKRSGAAQALRIPWVAALRTFGFTGRAENDGVAVDFNLKTDRAKLSPNQLPLAGGTGSPPVVRRPGEISIGVRDPGQIVDFVLQAGPAASSQFAAGRRQLEQAAGIDLKRDVADQLTGAASLNIALNGAFGARAEVRDPAAVKRTLRKLVATVPRLPSARRAGPLGLTRIKGGLYAFIGARGRRAVFGVIGRTLVAASDRARARELAAARPESVPGVSGSVVLEADARRIAETLLRRFAPQTGIGTTAFAAPLGQLTGSASSNTGGLRGKLKLAIH